MTDVTRRAFVVSTALAGGALASPAAAKTKPKQPKPRRPSGPPTFTVRDGHIAGDNGRVAVVIDGATGGIRSVANLRTGQQLLAAPSSAPLPWRMAAQAGSSEFKPQDFRHEILAGGQEVRL